MLVDLSLAQRLELTTARSCKKCADSIREIPTATLEIAGGIAIFTGLESPTTQAFGIGLGAPVSESDLDQVEDFFFSRGAPVTLELCPFIDGSFMELLKRRPYRLEEFSNVLYREVGANANHTPPGDGVTIRLAESNEDGLFTQIVAEGFSDLIPLTDTLRHVMKSFFHHPNGRGFLAFVEGEVAGGAYVSADRDLAEFYGAATRAGSRGRGVQTALIGARMAWAIAQGCTSATTTTNPGTISQRNFERAGFRVVYSRTKVVRELPGV
jgi:GNAT superfamily N-acetyltransferase